MIEPDRPNDIAIVNALLVEGEGLVVSVRNNSPIPIVGRITVDVREVATNALVGRMREGVELLPEAELAVTFEQITELDFTRHTVQLFSDALDDSDLTNNIFPR